ncbi:YfaZ family outer membrane protein [Solimonas sp. SE-A11]|uniref:YfaZ family outer membrane protein n=1 Tax=Solimonas sp. SE-A11 TaxID=3054954 RepID=UPI00259D20F2|nr:YfaZ family outer membrane protein [Solimonas sp. SE-A11]MDM4771726.1 YfaZ family outer membrane protein [Solimonas sp. SE-A11]
MKAKAIIGATLALAALPAAAATFDASIGEEAVRVGLEGDLSSVFSGAKGQYDLGALWRSENNADAFVPHIGVLLTGDTGARDAKVTAGLGIRAAYIDGENADGSAIALGGQVDVRMPGFERVALGAYGYFAPDVTTFGDTDKYYDVGLSLGYEVIKDASVYVGWRKVVAKLDGGGEIEADDGFNIGLRLNF